MASQAEKVDERETMYGDAKLLTSLPLDISLLYADEGSTGVPLGHNPYDRDHGCVYDLGPNRLTPGHSLWFGATRSGKGVSGIIPALLTTLSSVVAIDPKGELAWITAPRRRALGHRCVILDPWNIVSENYGAQIGVEETVTKFNPLSALDPESPSFADDVASIADALVVVDPNEGNSHWNNAAKGLIAGLIAAAVEMDPGKASLRDVRQLITADDDQLVRHIHAIKDANPASLAARKLRRFAKVNKHGEAVVTPEISSIRSTAETQTDLLDSEDLLDAMETDAPPFNLDELATGRVTMYLVLPPDKLSTHSRWLRMILTLTLRTIARQKKQPELPVLFVVDEMGTIGNLRMIEDSYGLLAGLGVRIAGYLQDVSQLKRDYPRSWETFISNSSVIGVLQVGDQGTAEYISKYLGTRTLVQQGDWTQHSRPARFNRDGTPVKMSEREKSTNRFGQRMASFTDGQAGAGFIRGSGRTDDDFSVTTWEREKTFHPRQVLLPNEVREVPEDELLLLFPGKFNARLKRYVYYSDPVFSPLARHDPNKPAPVIVQPEAPPVVSREPQPAALVDFNDLGQMAGKVFGKLRDRLNKR